MTTNVQTNLIDRVCGPNPRMLHLWPWLTKEGQEHALAVAMGEPIARGDVSVSEAKIVAVYTARETDGSSGIKFTLLALDGSAQGQLQEVYPQWVIVESAIQTAIANGKVQPRTDGDL